MTGPTLDPEFNRILAQRELEDRINRDPFYRRVIEYDEKHPGFFPSGFTLEEKIEYCRTIRFQRRRMYGVSS